MDIITLLLTAVGLAMDAFSVSVTNGIFLKKYRLCHSIKTGVFFGGFQFLMPCIGWFLGLSFSSMIEKYAPWISFFLLAFIGVKMIWEALHPEIEEESDCMNNKVLTLLAIATSIDALAVGVTFAVMNLGAFGMIGFGTIPNSLVIGVVAFLFSSIGVYIGNKCGDIFGNKAEITGGLVLLGIGIKILAESFM